jgi:hypothetical protein
MEAVAAGVAADVEVPAPVVLRPAPAAPTAATAAAAAAAAVASMAAQVSSCYCQYYAAQAVKVANSVTHQAAVTSAPSLMQLSNGS